ncbi:MAG: polysaccharide biosynthesis protein [Nitrosopumilus sp.]|uniref:SDR family NAD(P)-dependent oxidoreductase n=1 Tax=Nitrosopumilus sp. TaxID=2024843 RepID=UPI00247C1235|nr:SDR family NAD(P)-dependent oxidoreductase [Nitrosopumilus sp.]MCV0393557.1 polysaccharide biosynthesis protein [Nitrosopumilus sp.]
MFDGKKILITGGTGSLGQALTAKLLETNVNTIRIFSRDESKQVQMQSGIQDKRLRFLIGDIRDFHRLSRALEGIDIVIHAAALKHVPVAEYNPFEAVKTNVDGTQNLIEACLDNNVKMALAIGTDKAVSPFNTYGATKFLMERLFVSANYYKGNRDIKFLCVRYGNVLGSSNSIVPIIRKQIVEKKKITITDPSMTRFTITMNEALELIMRALKNGKGGEIFVPKLKAYRLNDMKDAIIELTNCKNQVEEMSVRPGEKFHEILINREEFRNTYENEQDFIIHEKQTGGEIKINGTPVDKDKWKMDYSSENAELLSKKELKEILIREKFF